MATLKLADSEVLPNTPVPLEGQASGPITLSLRGEKREFWFRAVEILGRNRVVFVCEVEDESLGNWLVYERANLSPATRASVPPIKKVENIALNWNPEAHALGRVFFLPRQRERRPVRILLGENGVGVWLDKLLRGHSKAQFDYESHLLMNDRLAITEWLNSELADSNSNISFAKRWAALDNEAQHELLLGENRVLIQQVMRWGLICESRIWERNVRWTWQLTGMARYYAGQKMLLYCYGTANFDDPATELPFLFALNHFLDKSHILKITESSRKQHRCVRNRMESVFFDLGVEVHGPPTAHEQLEATLNLSDWLRNNDAPDELLALLNSNYTR